MYAVQMPSLLERLGSLTSIRDTELLEQSLLKTLLSTLPVSDCTLYRTSDKQDLLWALHTHVSPGSTERVEIEYNNIQIPDDSRELIETVQRTLDAASRKIGDRVLNVYPLLGRAGINGYLVFESPQPMAMADASILRGVLQLYRNYYTLLDESQRDKLTGLLNRQALDHNLDRLLAAVVAADRNKQAGSLVTPPVSSHSPDLRRYTNKKLWLAVMDVDHFKRINDNFGHIVGDEILLMVAQIMHRSLRQHDLLYRYGGEEFIVITSTAEDDATLVQLERIRKAIQDRVFPQVGQVTLSIGYAAFDGSYSATELISRADRALYEAKRSGRNRVLSYASLVEAGKIEPETYGSIELF